MIAGIMAQETPDSQHRDRPETVGEPSSGLRIRRLTRPGLEPVDLDVAPGECVGVSGPSGAGKTLLLRAIADLDLNQGEVSLDGIERRLTAAPRWRRLVVYLPSESGWWADGVAAHFPDGEAALSVFSRLGLETDAIDWEVSRLSTGERQRLALARAFLLSPRVLLLDEPTSGLDPDATEKAEDALRACLRGGTAILMVTHDRDQARRLARRFFRMRDGRLEQDGGSVDGPAETAP